MIIGFPCPDPVKGLLIFVGDTRSIRIDYCNLLKIRSTILTEFPLWLEGSQHVYLVAIRRTITTRAPSNAIMSQALAE